VKIPGPLSLGAWTGKLCAVRGKRCYGWEIMSAGAVVARVGGGGGGGSWWMWDAMRCARSW
jgi:hypothetical protein